MITLSQRLNDYLAVRCSLGSDVSYSFDQVLRRFTAFADAEGDDHITVDLLLRWKDAFGEANNNTWCRRLSHVRAFAQWLQAHDARTEIPPSGLISGKWRRPRPYIYSDGEVAKIIACAARLPSPNHLRGASCSTLFGLIAVTGLRINEALRLDDIDVDLNEGVITVKRGKNGKARFVPISPSTMDRLRAYRARRNRLLGTTIGPFFRMDDGQRLTAASARYNFSRVSQKMRLRETQRRCKHGRGPRIHDLRHNSGTRIIPATEPRGASFPGNLAFPDTSVPE
jgi:integrase/recombinase XerD